MSKLYLILFCTPLLFIFVDGLQAQVQDSTVTAKLDTSQSDTTKAKTVEEMILEEIYIEAVIEKPNVAILPTREKPDFEEVEFVDRSFQEELKAGPEKLRLIESEFYTVKKVERLKKILEKKKE